VALNFALRKSMDFFDNPCNGMTFTTFVLALILDVNESFVVIQETAIEDAFDPNKAMDFDFSKAPVMDMLSLFSSMLHSYRIHVLCSLPDD